MRRRPSPALEGPGLPRLPPAPGRRLRLPPVLVRGAAERALRRARHGPPGRPRPTFDALEAAAPRRPHHDGAAALPDRVRLRVEAAGHRPRRATGDAGAL